MKWWMTLLRRTDRLETIRWLSALAGVLSAIVGVPCLYAALFSPFDEMARWVLGIDAVAMAANTGWALSNHKQRS